MLQTTQPFALGPAPRPSIILRPGLRALPPGVERYKVAGGGSLVVPIEARDEITFTDLEGLQPCEVIAAGNDGRIDLGIIGARADADAVGLKAILASGDEGAERTIALLRRRKIELGNARC